MTTGIETPGGQPPGNAAVAPGTGIVVTTELDVVDPGDGLVSLREAVETANGMPGLDTVTFDPGLAGMVLRLTQGEIAVTDSLNIAGDLDEDGVPDITVSGDRLGNDILDGQGRTDAIFTRDTNVGSNGVDDDQDGETDEAGEDLLDDNSRIFNGTGETVDLTLVGLVLTGGRTTAPDRDGGAVTTTGELVLTDTHLVGNSTAGDGSQGGAASATVVDLNGSVVYGNFTEGTGANGGGIYSGVLTVTDSEIATNTARGPSSPGGGAFGALVVISGARIIDNATYGDSSPGGGVTAVFSAIVSNTTIADNVTRGEGSGGAGLQLAPFALTSLQLSNSTVSGNVARGDQSPGGGVQAAGANLVNTTLSDNATLGLNAPGGGIRAETLTMANTTLAGNFTSGDVSPGGGAYVQRRIDATQSTFTGNSVTGQLDDAGPVDAAALQGPGQLGGGAVQIAPVTGALGIFANSILLGNAVAGQVLAGECISEIASGAGALHFRGQNIVGQDLEGFDPGPANPMIASGADRVENADPALVFAVTDPVRLDADNNGSRETARADLPAGRLADNGGQVETVALLTGQPGPDRPALDRAEGTISLTLVETLFQTDLNADGDIADSFGSVEALRFDARGGYFSRKIDLGQDGNSPDLGAYELQRPPEFSIAALDAERSEGDSGATEYLFEITRSGRLDGPVSVNYAVTGAGAAQAGGDDFPFGELPSGTVAFADLQEIATLVIRAETDTEGEPDEGFAVALSNPEGDPFGAGVPGVVTGDPAEGVILNDDAAVAPDEVSVVALSSAPAEGDEGLTYFPFVVRRMGDAPGPITLDLSIAGSGGTPADGDDLAGPPTGRIVLPEGLGSLTVLAAIAGDTEEEPDETFALTLSNLQGNGVLTGATASGTILNDDDAVQAGPAIVDIFPVAADRTEGDAGPQPFVFLLSRTGATGVSASVDYAAAPGVGDGAEGQDFAGGAFPAGTVAFAPGETTKLLVIDIAGDLDAEGDESFAVTLSDPGAGTAIGTAAAAGTIRDDDAGDGEDLPPLAAEDYAATPLDTAVTLAVLANDSDPEGGPLTVADLGADPAFGGMAGNGTVETDGATVTYTPDPGFNGVDSFSYAAVDAAGNAATAEVVVQVGPPPPPEPATGVQRGGPGDDVLTPGPKGIYLGLDGDDTLLISEAVQGGQTIVFEDRGNTVVQLIEGTQIVSSFVAPNAIGLTLRNGAQVQILEADDHLYDIGGNATTGAEGTPVDFAGFVTGVLGTTVPGAGGFSEGGFVEIPGGLPGVAEPAEGLVVLAGADAFDWG